MSVVSVTLHLGDCLDVMRSMPDACVDAVVTDPPWLDYRTGWYDASAWHKPIVKVAPIEYAGELFRLMRNASACLLWCRWDCFHEHSEAMRAAGFWIRNCIVWAKPNHTAGDLAGNVGNQHEMAVFATKGRWLRHGPRDVNLWDEPHLFSRDKRHHPTEKPIALMERSVRLVAPEGGTVLDPFMGSGTTGVACVREGRSFIGIEREPEYHAIAEARIAHARGETPASAEQPALPFEASA